MINERDNNIKERYPGVCLELEEEPVNYGRIKAVLILFFILTLCSIFCAGVTWAYANTVKPTHGFSFTKNAWIFWCWLPIPIISIILGFKYKKTGIKCKKNIVAGFIMAILLFLYGSFSLFPTYEQDYSNINAYRSIINADLPDSGELHVQEWGRYFDDDKTEYVVIDVYYDKDDVSTLERSIASNNKWIPCNSIKTELKALVPSMLREDSDAYYSIYNNTTCEYNTLPTRSGTYEIYAMKYDKSEKHLEIHRFIISFKN